MTVAGLLLAAGEGRRLGRPKALVEVAGERLVDRGVRLLRDGGCERVYVVTGAVPVDVDGAVLVANPDWSTGMASSLRAGLAAVSAEDDLGAVVVALVDQPRIGPEAVRRLLRAHDAGARVAVATYSGRRRNPVLLARSTWADVARLAVGDVGARPYLAAHADEVTDVPCDGTGSPDDLDTPDDLARLGP